MNDKNDGGMFGRLTALAVILAAVYVVHSVARGGFGCMLGTGASCGVPVPHEEDKERLSEKDVPAKIEAKAEKEEADEDAGLEKKAPVAPDAVPAEKN